MDYVKLLDVATNIGFEMLKCGAEIYRVEDSITRICKTYGVKEVNVFSIPSSIIATIYDDKNQPITISKRILEKNMNLYKLELLNSLSREICCSPKSFDRIEKKLNYIKNKKEYKSEVQLVGYLIIGVVMTLLFGGNFKDALFAGLISCIIKFITDFFKKFKAGPFFITIISAMIISILSVLCQKLGLAENSQIMIIGLLTLLVPGFILTNAIRDFMSNDIVAGIMKATESVLIGIAIAVGVFVTISLMGVS